MDIQEENGLQAEGLQSQDVQKYVQEIGSSETTRETSSIQFSFVNYISFGTPDHIPSPDTKFLGWFLGFFEAEGSFLRWPGANKEDRFGVEVTQKDGLLINKIRTKLGFGRVTEFTKKTGERYWRFYVHKRVFLEKLVLLFNGNFVTVKKRNQFKVWLDAFTRRHEIAIPFLRSEVKVSLKNAWLSGFLEGDGGFYVKRTSITRTRKKDDMQKFDVKMKFYLTQKDELEIFEQVRTLLKIPTNVYQITNGTTQERYNRIETHQLSSQIILRDYLEVHPFLGKRKINMTRWNRLLNYRINDYPVTEKSMKKVKRLIEEVNKETGV